MTREIKFRAWNIKEKRMEVPFSLFQIPKWTDPMLSGNELVAMQFTGLLDRNGKEIFEGDIVDVGENIEVKFDNGAYVLLGKNYSDYLYNFEDIEVIGNIYENPELLT